METIYFLIFVGVCACALVWANRRSKAKTDLAPKKTAKRSKSASGKLSVPLDNRLAHREQIWEARRKHASKGFAEKPSYIPKSESGDDPEYDGYSRRDRHHLPASGHIKKEARIEEVDEYVVGGTGFGNGKHASST